jgi:hypothetical protein
MLLTDLFPRKRKIMICSPAMGDTQNLLVNTTEKIGHIIIPWEVRCTNEIPEVTITADRVCKMQSRGFDYKPFLSFPRQIVVPAVSVIQAGDKCFVSTTQFRVIILNYPTLGSYHMHFIAEYLKDNLPEKFEFTQKIQFVKR